MIYTAMLTSNNCDTIKVPYLNPFCNNIFLQTYCLRKNPFHHETDFFYIYRKP